MADQTDEFNFFTGGLVVYVIGLGRSLFIGTSKCYYPMVILLTYLYVQPLVPDTVIVFSPPSHYRDQGF